MKQHGTFRISLIATAVGLALGASTAFAQLADDRLPSTEAPQPQQPPQPEVFVPQQADPQQPDVAAPVSPEQPAFGDAGRGIDEGADGGEQFGQDDRDAFGDEEGQGDRNASADNESQADARQGQPSDLDKIAEEHADISKFVEAVKAAGLADALTNGTQYTVFAPTNEALESEDIDDLLEPENREELIALIRAHVVADNVDREMAGWIGAAETIDGSTVDVSVEDAEDGAQGKLMVGDASAMDEDIEIGSLRVYAVDAVLRHNSANVDSVAENRTDGGAANREPTSHL
jgi:uncharacterized surface protein with fasciclin (FAS1) repeats